MGLSTTIPSVAIKKLIPIVIPQVMKLIDISSLIEIAINSLPLNIKCDDPRIRDIKHQLEIVQKLLKNLKKIKDIMKKLTNVFAIVGITATAIELIQLAIPAVPGVPQGPFAKLAIIAAVLAVNCKGASKVLTSMVTTMEMVVDKLESVLAFAITKLSSVCINESFPVSSNVKKEIDSLTTISTDTGVIIDNNFPGTNPGTAMSNSDIYLSRFYNEYNVSDDDLSTLNTIISELNDLSLTLKDHIQEAPADVVYGTGAPATDLGKMGDYYIDSSSQLIYGPKFNDYDWGESAIKY